MTDPCPHYQESGKYCSECGQQLMWKCPCNAPVGWRGASTWYPLSYRFCPGCGAACPVPLEVVGVATASAGHDD